MTNRTADAFLGGQLVLTQPKDGYRAGIDPVLLAAACAAQPGDRVLDLGCGVGTAILCLAARVDVRAFGLERLLPYAEMARENAIANGIAADIRSGDLGMRPDPFADFQFDHVIANPPFFQGGTGAQDAGRAQGRHEDTALADWLAYAARRLRGRGQLTIIQRAERVDALLAGMPRGLGSIEIQPIAPRPGRATKLVILRVVKSGRAALKLHAPMHLHQHAEHQSDAKDYTDEIEQILRHGAAFPWPRS